MSVTSRRIAELLQPRGGVKSRNEFVDTTGLRLSLQTGQNAFAGISAEPL